MEGFKYNSVQNGVSLKLYLYNALYANKHLLRVTLTLPFSHFFPHFYVDGMMHSSTDYCQQIEAIMSDEVGFHVVFLNLSIKILWGSNCNQRINGVFKYTLSY